MFAFASAQQDLVWGIAQPFAGRLADRCGAGKAILFCSMLYAVGLALMSQAQTGFGLSMTAGVVIGLGLSGTTFPIVFGAMACSTPPEKRSLAMGIAMSIGSLGQSAMLPHAMTLFDGIGWAAALIALALMTALMAPLSSGLFEKPHGVAKLPMTLLEILAEVATHNRFWLLSFGFFVCGFQVVLIATHLPAYLVDNGRSVKTGATVLALAGLFNIAGS